MLLCFLGALTGLLAGAVIIGFRFAVESTQAAFLPGGHHEDYEALAPHWRVAIATGGALAVGLLMRFVIGADRRTGVTHVMERVVFHQSVLPLRNALGQLMGGALSIISGHSVGREGPSVHLGAATGSQLGQLIQLPNNSLRTLIACGTAAAIGASFNTPLAGVAFAMEVVVMEYTIAGFLPVILAAVSATALTQFFYGAAPAFSVPPLNMKGLVEIPYVVLTGIIMGALAAAFIHALRVCSGTLQRRSIVIRMTLGGLGVGVVALAVPEVMGIGYDTVDAALHGDFELGLLAVIVVAKLIATAWVLGMGLPGGLIGPTLVIGAAAGGALGYLGSQFTPFAIAGPAFYSLIGMGAMMGATLRAPLAALTAMLELTANPNVIMPGMLAIVAATLTTSELFRTDSVFLTFLKAQGLDPRRNPLLQTFSRLGIARVMDRRLLVLPRVVERLELERALREDPRWIVVEDDARKDPVAIVPVTDVLQYVQESEGDEPVDLMEIPAKRLQPAPIEVRATLREALERLRRDKAEALYVTQTTAPGIRRYYGVVTRGDIENQYLG